MPETQTRTTKSAAETTASDKEKKTGLSFSRHFTRAGLSPYDEVEWERRTASITDDSGKVLF